MIGAVTAGCCSTKASARWISGQPGVVGQLPECVGRVEFALVVRTGHVVPGRQSGAAPGFGEFLVLAVAAGQPASGQRAPGQHAHPVLLRHRQDVGLDPADQQRIGRLLGDEPAESAPFADPLRLNHLVGRERRRTEGADLALVLQIGERGEGFFDIGVRVGAVNLIQVDPVGVQPAQAVLDLA